MNNGFFRVKDFKNEQVLDYDLNSKEMQELQAKIDEMKNNILEIPVIINGKEIRTKNTRDCILPHDKNKKIGFYHTAGEDEVRYAIKTAMESKEKWASMPSDDRMMIFLRAARLACTTWRATLNASTMLCQSKTIRQAEIDSTCELTDFFNANLKALSDMYDMQPMNSYDSENKIDYKPLDGFVYAVSPFNFTSIASNLISAPAIAGNTVIWKPASSAVYSSYIVYKLLQAAGLPDGVISFIPGNASMISEIVMSDENLAGVHFTGSTDVFNSMWQTIGKNINNYKSYPRLVGETGGKNFSLIHSSADINQVIASLIRGAFEYQGQKCSATSRAYIPKSVWNDMKNKLVEETKSLKMGAAEDNDSFISAVIDNAAYKRIKGYIDYAKDSDRAEIICGGQCSDDVGYFIEPTLILTDDIDFKTMQEEIFGPVLSIYVYNDSEFEEIMKICADSSKYALTGSIWANDREIVMKAKNTLRFSAGNFYINDKTTGAVVGQSPFGGSKASGTNDKAGTIINMLKWVSPRAIKENFIPVSDYRYKKAL